MNTELYIIAANLLVFVIAPFLPNIVYSFVESYVGAIILLTIALASISQGYLSTVATFTGIASLFAEAHARKARMVKMQKASGEANYEVQMESAPVILPNEIHPEVSGPEDDGSEQIITFKPKDDDGYNEFKPVDSSINEKDALPTISLSKDAANVYEENHLAEKQNS